MLIRVGVPARAGSNDGVIQETERYQLRVFRLGLSTSVAMQLAGSSPDTAFEEWVYRRGT